MHRETAPMVQDHRGRRRLGGSEVQHARDLYIRSLQRRVRDGSYFTPHRMRTAMERLVQSVLDGAGD